MILRKSMERIRKSNSLQCNGANACDRWWEAEQKRDILWFGGIMQVVLTGKRREKKTFKKGVWSEKELPYFDLLPKLKGVEREYVEIMHECWQPDYQDRPSALELFTMIEKLSRKTVRA